MSREENKITFQRMIRSLIFLSAIIVVGLTSCNTGGNDQPWTRSEIERYLGIEIPKDALYIKYDGTEGYGAYLNLTFSADPIEATKFAENICDGVLHQGYNPFDAIDVGFNFSYTHLIGMGDFLYYSYSPDAPEGYFGNRCERPQNIIHQILLDKTDPSLYRVRFQRPPACNTATPPLPCGPIGIELIEPTADFPLVVFGMRKSGDAFLLYSKEICIDINSNSHLTWRHLIGANVQVFIDDQPRPAGYIDTKVKIRRDLDSNEQSRSSTIHDYCLLEEWESGPHTMSIHIMTESGEEFSYSWQFQVD